MTKSMALDVSARKACHLSFSLASRISSVVVETSSDAVSTAARLIAATVTNITHQSIVDQWWVESGLWMAHRRKETVDTAFLEQQQQNTLSLLGVVLVCRNKELDYLCGPFPGKVVSNRRDTE